MRRSTLLLSLLLTASAFGATATIGTLNVTTLQSSGEASTTDYGPEDTWGYGTANQFTIEFVTVDDVGNPARLDPSGTNYVGSLDYKFAIAKYSATEDQLAKAKAIGGFNATFSSLGTNMPAGQIDHIEAMQFVNWLNVHKGYPKAYNIDISGNLITWSDSDDWAGGTNQIRNGAALYHLPSANEYYKAAQWDPFSKTWFLYGQGTNTPVQVNGYWANGSTNWGTAVCNQQFDARYPEWDSPGNIVNVTLTTSGGAITGITYDSFVSGHVVFESTNTFKIVQGAVTNATATVATWQAITNVPGTFTNFVAGTGYTDGVGSVTLGGYTVGVRIYTDGAGGVVGAEPTSGRFNTSDYSTVLDIVQAGGSGAMCTVLRYVEDTYTNGVRVPDTFTIVSDGTGYNDGAATFQTRHFGQMSFDDWLEIEPTTGLQYYKLCVGAAEVNRAGGPSPWGAVGLFGNVSNLTDTEKDFVNDGSTTWFRYYGFWWERNAVTSSNLGSEAWNVATATTGAWSNGFRVAKRLE